MITQGDSIFFFFAGDLKEPAAYFWSEALYSLYSEIFPESVHILAMTVLYRLI